MGGLLNVDNFSTTQDGLREPRGRGAHRPERRRAAREKPPAGGPAPARPPERPRGGGGARLRGRKDRRAPPPARPPAARSSPRARPPAAPARSPGGRLALTCLSRCRRWRPSTPPFPTRSRRHSCRRRRPCPTPAGDVTRTRRRSPRPDGVAALPNRDTRCLRVGGAWGPREVWSPRPRSPRAACRRPLPARPGPAPAPAPGPGEPGARTAAPRGRRRARLLRGVPGLGPRSQETGRPPPSPHLPGGPAPPLQPFLREDPSSPPACAGDAVGAPRPPPPALGRRAAWGPGPFKGPSS